jgi:hypothetical protein
VAPLPLLSFFCESGDHEDCAHKFGVAASLRGTNSRAMLCACECHASCPLAAFREVPEEEWEATCTCPGSAAGRVRDGQVRGEIAGMQERHREVMSSIDLGRDKTPEQIRALILDAYAQRGWEAPSDFEWLSRITSAGTARRAPGFRVAVELGRTIRSVIVALRSGDPPAKDPESSDDRGRRREHAE